MKWGAERKKKYQNRTLNDKQSALARQAAPLNREQ